MQSAKGLLLPNQHNQCHVCVVEIAPPNHLFCIECFCLYMVDTAMPNLRKRYLVQQLQDTISKIVETTNTTIQFKICNVLFKTCFTICFVDQFSSDLLEECIDSIVHTVQQLLYHVPQFDFCLFFTFLEESLLQISTPLHCSHLLHFCSQLFFSNHQMVQILLQEEFSLLESLLLQCFSIGTDSILSDCIFTCLSLVKQEEEESKLFGLLQTPFLQFQSIFQFLFHRFTVSTNETLHTNILALVLELTKKHCLQFVQCDLSNAMIGIILNSSLCIQRAVIQVLFVLSCDKGMMDYLTCDTDWIDFLFELLHSSVSLLQFEILQLIHQWCCQLSTLKKDSITKFDRSVMIGIEYCFLTLIQQSEIKEEVIFLWIQIIGYVLPKWQWEQSKLKDCLQSLCVMNQCQSILIINALLSLSNDPLQWFTKETLFTVLHNCIHSIIGLSTTMNTEITLYHSILQHLFSTLTIVCEKEQITILLKELFSNWNYQIWIPILFSSQMNLQRLIRVIEKVEYNFEIIQLCCKMILECVCNYTIDFCETMSYFVYELFVSKVNQNIKKEQIQIEIQTYWMNCNTKHSNSFVAIDTAIPFLLLFQYYSNKELHSLDVYLIKQFHFKIFQTKFTNLEFCLEKNVQVLMHCETNLIDYSILANNIVTYHLSSLQQILQWFVLQYKLEITNSFVESILVTHPDCFKLFLEYHSHLLLQVLIQQLHLNTVLLQTIFELQPWEELQIVIEKCQNQKEWLVLLCQMMQWYAKNNLMQNVLWKMVQCVLYGWNTNFNLEILSVKSLISLTSQLLQWCCDEKQSNMKRDMISLLTILLEYILSKQVCRLTKEEWNQIQHICSQVNNHASIFMLKFTLLNLQGNEEYNLIKEDDLITDWMNAVSGLDKDMLTLVWSRFILHQKTCMDKPYIQRLLYDCIMNLSRESDTCRLSSLLCLNSLFKTHFINNTAVFQTAWFSAIAEELLLQPSLSLTNLIILYWIRENIKYVEIDWNSVDNAVELLSQKEQTVILHQWIKKWKKQSLDEVIVPHFSYIFEWGCIIPPLELLCLQQM